jgi:hypothetical protein
MSIIQPDSIKAIAHSIDLPRLSDEAAKTLAPDVEYRLREVVQVCGAVAACLTAHSGQHERSPAAVVLRKGACSSLS